MDAGGGWGGGVSLTEGRQDRWREKEEEDDEEVRVCFFFFLYAWSLAAAAFPLGLWFAG